LFEQFSFFLTKVSFFLTKFSFFLMSDFFLCGSLHISGIVSGQTSHSFREVVSVCFENKKNVRDRPKGKEEGKKVPFSTFLICASTSAIFSSTFSSWKAIFASPSEARLENKEEEEEEEEDWATPIKGGGQGEEKKKGGGN
jgi:hypothetical protein